MTGPALQYDCERARLPAAVAERFALLGPDPAAPEFLSATPPSGPLRTATHRALRRVLSDFDAYGLLGMYRAHVFSEAQLSQLLGVTRAAPLGALLDVGAGNGDALAPARALFRAWHATEASSVMRRRLRARGVSVHDVDLCHAPLPGTSAAVDGPVPSAESAARHAANASRPAATPRAAEPSRPAIALPACGFDAVACLNVIDRVRYPVNLLRHAAAALRPGGRLLIAVPLPLRPHVDVGRTSVDQEQPLPIPADDGWEAGVTALCEHLLPRVGLSLRALGRVPYLCQGDATRPFHMLDDAVLVCQVAP